MTEAKSPREIAEGGITDLDAANYAIDYFSWWMTWEQERANKAEAYAAEQRRLLAEADAALDWVVRERREGHWPTGEMLADVRAATDRHRLRSSRPATEGKGD